MKNKIKTNIAVAALAAAAMASCGGGTSKPAAAEASAGPTNAQYVSTITVDDVVATWIRDNADDKLMPRSLFASASDALIDSLGLQDGVPSTISTFWVETQGVGILFDTGLGAPDSRLMDGLQSAGHEAADVKYIFLTHFHGDHIGGMMSGDAPAFPNAEVYASKAEYDAWMQMPVDQDALLVKVLAAYKERLRLFEFGDTLPGGVVAMDAVGHTPGHTAFRVGKLLIVGDLMHGVALQMANPDICAAYDMDTPTAIATRKRIVQYARDNGLTMAGMHFPAPAFIGE